MHLFEVMTTSIWQGTAEVQHYPKLANDAKVDVCIVGAGITGLSVAYHLAREGKKVMVLEDGAIGSGESGRTTAHLTNAMDDRIHWLEKIHGAEATRLTVESHGAAINRIQQIVQLESIDCDFERLDGYLLARDPGNPEELMQEAEAAQRVGITDVSLVDRAPIATFESGTALRFPGQGEFHILKYLSGLARAIVDKYHGVIHCDTHVEGIEGGDPCKVKVDGGLTVTAGCVVACTNSSISDYVRTHMLMEAMRTYVIAAVVPRGSVERALYWDTGSPYHYVRVVPIGEEQPGVGSGVWDASNPKPQTPNKGGVVYDALIVGGEDHKVGRDDDDGEDRWANLERWMRQRWPSAGEIIYRWSGQVLEPADGLAYIGPNPDGAENVFMASGDSGQGMTHGTIAGMLLADMLLGRENPWATLYHPKRITLRAKPMGDVAKHNLDVLGQFAKGYLTPGEVKSWDEVPPGEGRLMRRNGKKLAVYKDEAGKVTEKSAVCTHLKCIVEWNGTEKSWDCPCHGSRFAPTGEVLNGPAIMALEDPEPEGSSQPAKRQRARKASSV